MDALVALFSEPFPWVLLSLMVVMVVMAWWHPAQPPGLGDDLPVEVIDTKCLVPDGCPDPRTGMPCNNCWRASQQATTEEWERILAAMNDPNGWNDPELWDRLK